MRLPYLQVTQETWGRARLLAALLGVDRHVAMGIILDLWRWAVELGAKDEAPTGRIDSPRAAFLLGAALEWKGSPDELVTALVELEFLERTETGLRVRGLDRYKNAWDNRGARSIKAKAAADKRWGRNDTGRHAPAMLEPCSEHASSNAQAMLSDAQTQTQTQTQKEEKALSGKLPDGQADLLEEAKPKPKPRDAEVQRVFEHWRQVMGKALSAKLTRDRQSKVAARLREGYTAEDLCRAVDGCAKTPHNMGENERGERFDDLELICRDGSHVDRFMGNAAKQKPQSIWDIDLSPITAPNDDSARVARA